MTSEASPLIGRIIHRMSKADCLNLPICLSYPTLQQVIGFIFYVTFTALSFS